MNIIDEINQEQMTRELPRIRPRRHGGGEREGKGR